MRKYRKREHIENYLKATYEGDTLFEDVFLYHNSLPEVDFDSIDTEVEFLGKKISYPFMINAMTGGNEYSNSINTDLAKIAKELNVPIAVGSEIIALEDNDPSIAAGFKIVREIMGEEGVVIGNANAFITVEDAKRAVELINADALQIHLNPAQELIMQEGDRDFTGVLKNIEKIVSELDVPVIAKEVGFGMSEKVVEKLYEIGVRYVDISGHGGTNFIEVEDLRNPDIVVTELYPWGIPTALSIIEATRTEREGLFVIGSGGIKNGLELAKAIALGADMGAMSGEILNYLVHGGYQNCVIFLDRTIHVFKMVMVMTGCKNIQELKNVNYKLTGKLKDLV